MIFKEEERDKIREAAIIAAFEANERREIGYSTETLIQAAVEAAIKRTEEIIVETTRP